MDNLKHGRWVMTEKGAGILQRERVNTEAGAVIRWDVHLVDDAGDTRLIAPVASFSSVRQATLAEIPAPRRPEPSERVASMGYAH